MTKLTEYLGFGFAGLISATLVFSYQSSVADNYTSQISQFGGYKGDGDYSVCERFEGVERKYCREEKNIPLIKTSYAPILLFLLLPSFMILVLWVNRNNL